MTDQNSPQEPDDDAAAPTIAATADVDPRAPVLERDVVYVADGDAGDRDARVLRDARRVVDVGVHDVAVAAPHLFVDGAVGEVGAARRDHGESADLGRLRNLRHP